VTDPAGASPRLPATYLFFLEEPHVRRLRRALSPLSRSPHSCRLSLR